MLERIGTLKQKPRSPSPGQGQCSFSRIMSQISFSINDEYKTQTDLIFSYLQKGPSYCSVHFLLVSLSEEGKSSMLVDLNLSMKIN